MAKTAPLPATLSVTIDGTVAILTLTRVEKRNALDDDTILGIRSFFEALPPQVKAVVLNGAGQHFCAGLDLGEVAGDIGLLHGIEHSRMWHKAFSEMQYARVPVFAVLHGAVVGGGFELAAAAHVRIAERSAYYALPEGQRGIFLGGGGTMRLTRLIGVPAVQDLMLTGRTLSAEDGYRIGASQYLVDDGAGLALAVEMAKKAGGNAPLTNYAIINALPHISESDPAAGLFTESLMAAIAETSPEAKERLKAFLEKRAAKVLHKS